MSSRFSSNYMATFIAFILSNFTLTFFVLGLFASAISCLMQRSRRDRRGVVDIFLGHYLFFAIGLCFFYNFVMHVFFAEMAAKFIGWANSPFQYEVGYASLGFSVVAILAHRSTFQFRLAAILGPALFLWGAAVGHVYQIIVAHNFAAGNAGMILWTDIFMPIIGFVLLYFAYPRSKGEHAAASTGIRD